MLSAGEVLQALLDNGEALTVRLVRARLAPIRKPLRMNVAEGRHPGPNPFKNSTLHPGLASLFPNVVFELRVAGQHGFGHLAKGAFIDDRLRHGLESRSGLGELRLNAVMVRRVPREPVQFPDDEHVNLMAVPFAIIERLDQLRSRRGRG